MKDDPAREFLDSLKPKSGDATGLPSSNTCPSTSRLLGFPQVRHTRRGHIASIGRTHNSGGYTA